jgi:carbamoyl-phosphate synthase large subunit
VSPRPLTVLVLGVGGNIGQGILKALAVAELEVRLLAACVTPWGAGLYRADRAYVSPRADDADFLPWLLDVCRDEGVDAVLSGVEEVLAAAAPHADEIRGAGAALVSSPPEVLEVGRDKLRTGAWLREQALPHPAFAAADDPDAVRALRDRCGYPLVAKPRVGKGGRGVALVDGDDELSLHEGRPEVVLQEHVGHSGEEYTAGCFSDRDGRPRGVLVMRRELVEGTTYRAQAGAFPEVRDCALDVVRALAPVGPCNVQLRLDADGRPVPFELNVRFSGTSPARARLGFNEVEASLRHLVLGEPAPSLPEVTDGVVLRYWNELYVDRDAVEELERGGAAGVKPRPARAEDWGLRDDTSVGDGVDDQQIPPS